MAFNIAYLAHDLARVSAKTYPDKPALIFDGGVPPFGQVARCPTNRPQACAARDSCAETESGCNTQHPAIRSRLAKESRRGRHP